MFKRKTISTFSEIELKIMGMRMTEVYRIVCNGDLSELSMYYERYTGKKDEYDLIKSASCSTEAILELLNRCNIAKWDGFFGKNPIGVRDGYMFDFTAQIDGESVRASGSNNYPKNYREFRDEIIRLLNEQTDGE